MSALTERGLRPIEELAADKPHGTRLRYIAGCKCTPCRRANSDYERQRRAARAAGDWNGLVPADRARTERKILAVTRDMASDRALVAPGRTFRLIDQLLEEGFTKAELARRLGYRHGALQFRRHRMTARNVARIERLHRSLTT